MYVYIIYWVIHGSLFSVHEPLDCKCFNQNEIVFVSKEKVNINTILCVLYLK